MLVAALSSLIMMFVVISGIDDDGDDLIMMVAALSSHVKMLSAVELPGHVGGGTVIMHNDACHQQWN